MKERTVRKDGKYMDKKTQDIIKTLNRCKIEARALEGSIQLSGITLPGNLKQGVITLPTNEMKKLLDEALIVSVSMLEKGTFPLVLTALYYIRYTKDGGEE